MGKPGRKKKAPVLKAVNESGPKKERSESEAVRHLTLEEGWRFLYVRKGDEMLNEQVEDLHVMKKQAEALRSSAALLVEKAEALEKIAEEKAKRINAQRDLWNSTHDAFRKKLNLPAQAKVGFDFAKEIFTVVMPPPHPPQALPMKR